MVAKFILTSASRSRSAIAELLFILNWLPWQYPLSIHQMNPGFVKPLHKSTNPENLVKIRSVVPENLRLIDQPLEIFKK